MDHNIRLHNHHSIYPTNVIIICEGSNDDHRIINSQEEMNQLLEEVKLYNSENKNQKRIISI